MNDWNEFHLHFPEEKLQTQGARCMDCGIPFCHTGTLIGRHGVRLPVNNLIPEWNDLVYRGRWREALDRLHEDQQLPRVHRPGLPCALRRLLHTGYQRAAGDDQEYRSTRSSTKASTKAGLRPDPPAQRTGKKVAVVGSGPSGLACADQLNKAGHEVTVYERADRIGGLLMYGIPNMKLDKKVVQRRVDLMAAEGVKFVTGIEIGKDIPAARLREEFDAVVLCGGATKPRDLPVEGRDLSGIHFAMDFLRGNTRSLLDQYSGSNGKGGHIRPFPPRQRCDRHWRRRHRHRLCRHLLAPRLQ